MLDNKRQLRRLNIYRILIFTSQFQLGTPVTGKTDNCHLSPCQLFHLLNGGRPPSIKI